MYIPLTYIIGVLSKENLWGLTVATKDPAVAMPLKKCKLYQASKTPAPE